jgi:hypothetical protein
MIEWTHPLESDEECNNVEVTPEGNVLYAYSKGARLIDRNHATLWDYKAGDNEEIHSVSRLKEGGFLIGVCGSPARIVELDNKGAQTKEIKFPTLIFNTHYQFRNIVKTDSGHYIVPLLDKHKIIRVTPEGQLKNLVFVAAEAHAVLLLDTGNLLVSCGSGGVIKEINPKDTHFERFIVTQELKGATLLYVAEIFQYPNGNRLIANSNMYSDDKSQPLLLEIDPNKEVVWALPFNKKIPNITAVFAFKE